MVDRRGSAAGSAAGRVAEPTAGGRGALEVAERSADWVGLEGAAMAAARQEAVERAEGLGWCNCRHLLTPSNRSWGRPDSCNPR